ncbi:hypothetical protein ACTXT7_013950 [Hymenolepis weldensis]
MELILLPLSQEVNQHTRANDFEISLDAYKIALEKQFSENQTFIRKLSKVLEASQTNLGTSVHSENVFTQKSMSKTLSGLMDMTRGTEPKKERADEFSRYETGEGVKKKQKNCWHFWEV